MSTIKTLWKHLKELDMLDEAIFDDSITEEQEDELIDRFNSTATKAAELLTQITAGQITIRTAELMVRAKRSEITSLVNQTA